MQTTAAQPPSVTGPPGSPMPLWAALLAAPAAGVAMLLAFPPYGWWPLAPIGVALLAAAVHRRRLRAGLGLGLLTGLTFFLPLLSWTNLEVGNLPWLLLGGFEACYLALMGAAAAWASPVADRWRASWPVLTGLLWVAQETLRSTVPFGGFPWGRLAFSQADGPLVRFAALGGAPLVTFAVALVGGLLAAAAWAALRHRWRPLTGAWAAVIAVAAVALLAPVSSGAVTDDPVGADDAVTVAIVQGNVPRLGLDFNAQRQAVLDNHADATVELARQVAAGQAARPDLVVWPENSSDIDPLRYPAAAARISEAADAVGAPILVGAVLSGPGPGQVRNAGLLWQPGGGPDLDQLYIKRRPVPFAEYVPFRDLARLVSKEVDRVRSDFVAGTTPGVVATPAVTIGDVICFEVAYDDVVRDTVTGGGRLIVVQTNNATFNNAEALQQLAMVRLRAVEHGMPALMASTVGVSGFVDRDGRVSGATEFFTEAVVVRQVRPGDGTTVATRVGRWPEAVLVLLAVSVLVTAGLLRRSARRATGDAGSPAETEER